MSEQTIKPRPLQTKIKHSILKEYLGAWGGIILHGTRNRVNQTSDSSRIRFVFVDTCAGAGRYAGDADGSTDTIYGSPVIAIQSIDALRQRASELGIHLSTRVILIEEKNDQWQELQASLKQSGYTSRIKETTNLPSLIDGDVCCIHDNWLNHVNSLLSYTRSPEIFTFWFIDPYGPTAIPMSAIRRVVSTKQNDAIIYVPTLNMVRITGLVSKSARFDSLSSAEHALIENYDNMFGGGEWQNIATLFSDRQDPDESARLELKLIEHYESSLKIQDDLLVTKSIPLRLADKDRTVYHLCLTTHDVTGAMRMNQVMYDAKLDEHDLRTQLSDARKYPDQASLFPQEILREALSRPPRPGAEEIAVFIFESLNGRSIEYRNVLALLVNTNYFPDEVKRALQSLRKNKKVSWEDKELRNSTLIRFNRK